MIMVKQDDVTGTWQTALYNVEVEYKYSYNHRRLHPLSISVKLSPHESNRCFSITLIFRSISLWEGNHRKDFTGG